MPSSLEVGKAGEQHLSSRAGFPSGITRSTSPQRRRSSPTSPDDHPRRDLPRAVMSSGRTGLCIFIGQEEEEGMRALVWHGKEDIRCDTVTDPEIEQPRDAIVKVTSCAI